jgi:hypothetical protein
MAAAQIYEVEVTPIPLNLENWNDVYDNGS